MTDGWYTAVATMFPFPVAPGIQTGFGEVFVPTVQCTNEYPLMAGAAELGPPETSA